MSYEISGKEFRDGRGGKKALKKLLLRHSSAGRNPAFSPHQKIFTSSEELDHGLRRDDGLFGGFLSRGPKNEGRHDTAASA